jgi:drug/metabolite transporter (DMT)-like permease
MKRGRVKRGMTRTRATLIGFTAILLWSLLALLTAWSGTMPPFQMTAITFAIGAFTGLIYFRSQGRWPHIPNGQSKAVLLGITGLFLYHFLYFTALRNAPAVEASLIAYLWPLLIVVGSALMPGEKMRFHHVFGALLGLGGAALILIARNGAVSGGGSLLGYGAAIGCAFTWAAYSLSSRRFAEVPTDAVVLYCAATSILSLACHFAFEVSVWPDTVFQWAAIVALGIGPLGIGFFTWDIGCKNGDIQILGASSYAAPLLSTLVLIVAGVTAPTWIIFGACLLITLGAVIAAKDMIFKKAKQTQPV